MRRFSRTAPVIIFCAFFAIAGCSLFNASTPAQDAANQKAISNRQALVDARALYASTERMIVTLHRNGSISDASGRALVSELQTTVHPLLDAAQSAMISGDFDTAILKVTNAIAAVTSKLPAAPKPATRPAFVPYEPPYPEPQQAAFPVAVILGEIALTALQAYQRKKAEEQAAGISDQARIDELDKQLAAAASDDSAADAEADTEFGIQQPPLNPVVASPNNSASVG